MQHGDGKGWWEWEMIFVISWSWIQKRVDLKEARSGCRLAWRRKVASEDPTTGVRIRETVMECRWACAPFVSQVIQFQKFWSLGPWNHLFWGLSVNFQLGPDPAIGMTREGFQCAKEGKKKHESMVVIITSSPLMRDPKPRQNPRENEFVADLMLGT